MGDKVTGETWRQRKRREKEAAWEESQRQREENTYRCRKGEHNYCGGANCSCECHPDLTAEERYMLRNLLENVR